MPIKSIVCNICQGAGILAPIIDTQGHKIYPICIACVNGLIYVVDSEE